MTYKMSLKMAENVVAQANEGHQGKSALLTGPATGSGSKPSQDHNNPVVSAVESLGKKLVGLKFPFVSHSHTTPSIHLSQQQQQQPHQATATTPTSPSTEYEANADTTPVVMNSNSNSSKSKRPISAQMYETVSNTMSSPVAVPHSVNGSF